MKNIGEIYDMTQVYMHAYDIFNSALQLTTSPAPL